MRKIICLQVFVGRPKFYERFATGMYVLFQENDVNLTYLLSVHTIRMVLTLFEYTALVLGAYYIRW